MQAKLSFCLSLWVPGCFLQVSQGPKTTYCKNAGFPLFEMRKHRTNAGKMRLCWTGAPKSSQLGLLRCGCEATFSLLCKTRKQRKNAGCLALFGSLGALVPPLGTEGFCNQVIFHRKQENTVKMQSKSLFLELGFPKKAATQLF